MAADNRVGKFLNNLRQTLKEKNTWEKTSAARSPNGTPSTTNSSPWRSPRSRETPRSFSGGVRSESFPEPGIKFNWRMARAFVQLRTQPADTFSVSGIPFSQWPKIKVPTLGASPASCRVQEMYTVSLPPPNGSKEDVKLFVKIVPVKMWNYQWAQENHWNGEFTTDGENFVMEAAALAFLHEYAPGITPKLLSILEFCNNSKKSGQPNSVRRSDDAVTHMVIVSELYGEDLLDYLDRRDRKNKPLNAEEKRALQVGCVLLMKRLHDLGLAHLDFTPENILVGKDGLRLCDFAKSTPIVSTRLRHVQMVDAPILYPFESCEPTVGKGAYMPPECWKIYWRLEHQRIMRPLEDLGSLKSAAERVAYYFKVASADAYMLGVVLFWIWSDGGVWKCSDPKQDEKFYHLMKSEMNLDLFRECRDWPATLKDCLSKALVAEPWRRNSIDELLAHEWLCGFEDSEDHLKDYISKEAIETLLLLKSNRRSNFD